MRGVAILIVALLALAGMVQLERDRWALSPRPLAIGATPATLWMPPRPLAGAPVVVVAHGFAGSQQMMHEIARDLAHVGFPVVTYDLLGHGRHPLPLTGDVTRVEGATARLVDQAAEVAQAAMAQTGSDRVALLGHSMATDVVIRAARRLDEVPGVVVLSMYSDAVTPAFPPRLLAISGAWEGHLRRVALDALHQVDPEAGEGQTARAAGAERRAAVAPHVGHVGVLYSAVTRAEVRDWIARGADVVPLPAPAPLWPWRLAVLTALVALFRPAARTLPRRPRTEGLALRGGELAAVLAVPVLPAATAAIAVTSVQGPGALGGFAGLSAFLAVWGAVQLALLWRWGARPAWPMGSGMALLGLGALAFALLLDRHGAAFLPVGPRWTALAMLLPGTLAFALADALIAQRAPWWHRGLARLAVLAGLAAVMAARPIPLGLMFTVLPVLVLAWLVFGTMAARVARRQGPETAALPMALILAWALAASTPLIAG